jgi:hypothetical protein
MKKWILICAVALIGRNAVAQTLYGPGIKAGANFSTITGDDADDVETLIAFYAGFFYNVMISEMFSIQPELVYSGQGAKFKDSDNARLKLNYLNLSGILRYNTKSGFFVGTGPQFGILLSAKIKDDNTTVDFKEFVKSTDFAWAFLLGYEFASGFGLYGRYNLGLANISEDSDGDVKNSVIQVGFRYVMAGKKN